MAAYHRAVDSPAARTWRGGNALLVVALLAMAVHLRPAATSIGPVLAEMQADLGFNDTVAGLLTAMPGIGFASVGVFAGALGARLGLSRALATALLLTAAGLLGRAFMVEPAGFLALSLLAIGGMAVGNVLVPPFIKANFGLRTARMTSLYTVALAIGAALPALLNGWLITLPGGWRASIGAWGSTALLALVPWVALVVWDRRGEARGEDPVADAPDSRTTSSDAPPSLGRLLRSRTALALALFFGTQSMHAYVAFGWLGQAYRDGGLDAGSASLMLAIYLVFGIPTGFVMPHVVHRVSDLRPVMVLMGSCSFVGFLGVLLLPTTLPWVWVVLLGISGAAFPVAITLITTKTRDHRVTMQVSAFVQSVGYVIAAAGPFLVGLTLDVFGSWHVPLIGLAASAIGLAVLGVLAASGPMVDDDLR